MNEDHTPFNFRMQPNSLQTIKYLADTLVLDSQAWYTAKGKKKNSFLEFLSLSFFQLLYEVC
jgi:hypothetical protein